MKTVLICLSFFILTSNGYCQENTPEVQLSRDAYLKKSKAQKQTAWTLLGIGTVSMGAGLLLVIPFSGSPGQDIEEGYFGGLLITGGFIVDLVSIPFFTASSRNKRRAMRAVTSVKMEDVPAWSGVPANGSSVPALTVRVSF